MCLPGEGITLARSLGRQVSATAPAALAASVPVSGDRCIGPEEKDLPGRSIPGLIAGSSPVGCLFISQPFPEKLTYSYSHQLFWPSAALWWLLVQLPQPERTLWAPCIRALVHWDKCVMLACSSYWKISYCSFVCFLYFLLSFQSEN